MDKPDVDFIEGLSPAVSIDQKSTSKNPRSTVGTITEVYDYLRLLYARIGKPHCPVCGEPITKQTPQQIVDRILEMPEGTRFQVLAPVIRERKGEYVDLFADLQTKGFARVRIDGVVHSLTEPPKLKKQEKHTIEAVVDRLVNRRGRSKQRITDSIETALGLAGGAGDPRLRRPARGRPAPRAPLLRAAGLPERPPAGLDELEPRSFSFNSPFGACPVCTGLGTRKEVDPELVVPGSGVAPLNDGAIAPWSTGTDQRVLPAAAAGPGRGRWASTSTPPGSGCPPVAQKAVLHGIGDQVHVSYRNRYGRDRSYYASYEGVVPWIERRYAETDSDYAREKYEGYMREVPCPSCEGTRLKPEILPVTVGTGWSTHRRPGRAVDREAAALAARPRPDRARPDDRRAGAQGDQRPARLPASTSGCDYLSLDRAGRDAGRRRGAADPAGHPDRLRPRRACCTCWTSRRSACTSATTTG